MPMDRWDACNTPVDPEALKGRPCFGGLDLSTTTDVSALVLLFPPTAAGEKWTVLPYFFLPEDNIEARVKRDRVPYDVWARQELFTLTSGSVICYDTLRARINELGKLYDVREIVFDRWNAQQIVTQLAGDGFEMVELGQGFASLSAPTKRLLELVLSGDLAHGGHAVLRWMASNVMVATDPAGNIKPDKSKCREKIDGIAALIDALARAITVPLKPKSKFFKPFYV
jgi:phage terminase large subunit-like protein